MNPAAIHHIRAAREALIEAHPELADDAEFLTDVIEGQTDATAIMGRLIEERNDYEAKAAACKSLAERYEMQADRWQTRSNVMRQMMRAVLDAAGLPRIKTAIGTASMTQGRMTLVLCDGFTAPQGYQKIKIEPDKAAIKAALEAGEVMPGAALKQSPDFVTVR
jgi:ATPase subunit of ABC transporter with duplicated ATPase domains